MVSAASTATWSQADHRAPEFIFVIYSLRSGGAEKQLLWMAQTLVQEGARCSVFELQSKQGNQRIDGLVEAVSRRGVEVHRSAPGESYGRRWWRFRRLIFSRRRAFVWTWGYRAEVFMLPCAWLGRGRWITSLRFASAEYVHRGRWLSRLCQPHVSYYVANSWANCEMLESVCPGVMPHCRVVYNAVEEMDKIPVDLPAARPPTLKVHMLGNIDPGRKGYDHAVRLAEGIRDARWPVEIHVAGRSDSGQWLPEQIAQRGLSHVMYYHGETGDPIGYLRTAHAYLMTSRTEGTPNSLLEAMSLGLPSISTKVGDLARLASDGNQLRLVDIGDMDAARVALGHMLEHWPETVAMGQRGRQWCRSLFNPVAARGQLLPVASEMARFSR